MSRGPASGSGNDERLGHYTSICLYYCNITHLPMRLHVHDLFGREFVRHITKVEAIGLKPSGANEIRFPNTVEGGPPGERAGTIERLSDSGA